VRVEPSPGITVDDVRLADIPMRDLQAQWTGGSGPLARGLRLAFSAGDRAAVPDHATCRDVARARRSPDRKPILVGAAAIALLVVAGVGWRVARKRRRPA
jgi:hypothetical protein